VMMELRRRLSAEQLAILGLRADGAQLFERRSKDCGDRDRLAVPAPSPAPE
jgi:hypothetical protein